jgi:hypothetical protein
MVDENKLLEQFAKALNVEVKDLDKIVAERKKQSAEIKKPVLKKSFKDFVKENKTQKPIAVIEEQPINETLFQLIKKEIEKK